MVHYLDVSCIYHEADIVLRYLCCGITFLLPLSGDVCIIH